MGSLEKAIFATRYDGLERLQQIYWDNKTGYVYGKLTLGNEDSVKTPLFDQVNSKAYPLLLYHTHPSVYGLSSSDVTNFSIADIVAHKICQTDSYIYMVGSDYGLIALLHTARTARTPFSSIFEGLRAFVHLKNSDYAKVGFVGFYERQKRQEEIAQILEYEGYGYYSWIPKGGIIMGSLREGVTLQRVLAT